MKNKVLAGYVINLLMLVYLAVGVAVVLSHSVTLGILYVVLIFLSFVTVAYSYCAKCSCRFHSCTHLWVGKLTRFLPQRKPSPYTFGDWVGASVYVAGLHLLPQYWLWQNKVLFTLFWVLAMAVFLFGPFYVCKMCKNGYCPLNKNVGADTFTV